MSQHKLLHKDRPVKHPLHTCVFIFHFYVKINSFVAIKTHT